MMVIFDECLCWTNQLDACHCIYIENIGNISRIVNPGVPFVPLCSYQAAIIFKYYWGLVAALDILLFFKKLDY